MYKSKSVCSVIRSSSSSSSLICVYLEGAGTGKGRPGRGPASASPRPPRLVSRPSPVRSVHPGEASGSSSGVPRALSKGWGRRGAGRCVRGRCGGDSEPRHDGICCGLFIERERREAPGKRLPPYRPGRGGNPELICPSPRREGAASARAQTRSSPDAPNKHSGCAGYRTLIPQTTVPFGPVGHPGTFEIKGSRLHF